jgi:hypothetical protein
MIQEQLNHSQHGFQNQILMSNTTQEIWKDIPGYEGLYQVSDLGRVKSFWHKNPIIMRQSLSGPKGKRYLSLHLTNRDGISKPYKVHVLVADTFLGKSPGLVTDHDNNIKTDNRLCNLKRITNRLNSSKDKKNKTSNYTGVAYYPQYRKYKATIKINGKTRHIGMFKNEIDASEAYQRVLNWLKPDADEDEIHAYWQQFPDTSDDAI